MLQRAWSEGDHPDLFGSRLSENTGVASPDIGTTTADSPNLDLDPEPDPDLDSPSSLDIPDADAVAGACEPSVERLRLLLCEAASRAHSDDSAGDSEDDKDGEDAQRQQRRQRRRPRQRQKSSDDAREAAGFRSRDGKGKVRSSRAPFFAPDDREAELSSSSSTEEEQEQEVAADIVGAVAVAAAVEAVLMCPPQVLARAPHHQSSSLVSSLLRGRGTQGSGADGLRKEDAKQEEAGADARGDDEAAVMAAVAAALAWSPPRPPRLEMVAEEGGGGDSADDGIAASSSKLRSGRVASTRRQPWRQVSEGARRGGGGGGYGVDGIKAKAAAVAAETGKEEEELEEMMPRGGETAWREARQTRQTFPPSPLSPGLANGVSWAERAPTREDRPGVAGGSALVVAAGGGRTETAASRCPDGESFERRHSFAGVTVPSQNRAASVSPSSGRAGGELLSGGGRGVCRSRSVCARQPAYIAAYGEEALAEAEGVFGRAPVGIDTATAGPTARIAALPKLELARLSQIDRLSDHGGNDGDTLSTGASSKIRNNFFDCSAVAAAPGSSSSNSLLVRVGAEAASFSGVGDGGDTTPYRFRRLAGFVRGWPAGVNPTRREEWLAPVEFEAVFGVPFATFRKLPSWKKIMLKQEVGLF